MDHELPSPASRTLVCEAEEIESFGFGPHPDRSRQGLMPKRHEPRLFRVEGQSKPFESLGKHLQYLLGILSILKADCYSACKIDPRIASPRMLLNNSLPVIGVATPNR